MSPELHIKTRLRNMYAYLHEPEYMRSMADLYWRFLLSCATLLVLCAMAYGGFQLFSALKEITPSLPVAASKDTNTLTRAKLEEVLTGVRARADRFNELKTRPTAFTDPSR